MRRAATPCLLPEIIIIDTSDSEPDPAQSLYRVAELDLEGCVKPILQSEIRFRKAGRTSRERIERVCPPQQVRKFCAGTQKLTNQASSKQLIDVVSAVRHTQLAAFLDLGVGMDRGAPGPWRRARCPKSNGCG